MKKLIVLLPLVVFLVFATFASAALYINEGVIEQNATAGSPIQSVITLNNTGSSDLTVNFIDLDKVKCISDASKALNVSVLDSLPITVPANSLVETTLSFAVPSNQLACRYYGNIYANGGGFQDGITADITVRASPNIDVLNRTITVLKELTSVGYLRVAIKNTGNTNLNLVYQYSNFTYNAYNGKSLVPASSGNINVGLGATTYLTIPVPADDALADGNYTSTLRLNSTLLNKQYPLSAYLKTPVLSVSLPNFTMTESDRNKTVTTDFKIKNNGDYPLEGIGISTNVDSKYNLVINGVPDSLNPGDEATVTISAFIPEDEKTTIHKIADLTFSSDKITRTIPLNLNVKSLLKIESVIVTIDGSKNTISTNGNIVSDKETYPGSTFTVQVKVCNKYDDADFSISNIEGTVTFEGIDDGSDLESDTVEFKDLDGKKCDTETATFDIDKIPYLTDEGTYDMAIEVSGDDDEYDITQADEWKIGVEVFRKDTTSILFDQVSLNPLSVNCGGTASLDITAYNIGDRDNDAKLRITSPSLGIDITKYFKIGDIVGDDCDAIDEPDEKCIGVDHTFILDIPSNVSAATYPIDLILYYSETKQTDKRTVNLGVNCGGYIAPTTPTNPTTPTTPTNPTTPTYPTNPIVNPSTPGNVIITPSPNTGSAATGTPVRVKDVSGGNSLWIAGLIAGNILLVVIIVLVLLAIFRSKAT